MDVFKALALNGKCLSGWFQGSLALNGKGLCWWFQDLHLELEVFGCVVSRR